MKTKERTFWLVCAGAALLLSALVYAPMFTGKVPFPSDFVFDFPAFAPQIPNYVSTVQTDIGDLVTSFYPYRTLAARAVREGTLPLWNPYILSGAPFLANSQSALFYPPTLLYFILPAPIAWGLAFVLERLLAAVFTALLLRRIGATTAGAAAAGIMFAFCGFLDGWQGQAMADAAIWLPLICYAIVRLHSTPSGTPVAIAAVAFAMPVLAGHPETAAHLALTGVALAAFLWIRKPEFAFAKAFTVSALLATGLAAVQILPTLEWLRLIEGSFKIQWPSRPLWTILSLVSRDITQKQNSIGLLLPEQAGYVAMMTFVAAPVALLRKGTRGLAVFFALWTAVAFSAAFGIGPAHWAIQHIPVVSHLKNARLVLVASFGTAVLAGLGISEIENLTRKSARTGMAALLAFAGAGAGMGLLYAVHRFPMPTVIEFTLQPRFGAYLLLAILLLVFLRLRESVSAGWFGGLGLALVVLDLATVSYGAIPFTKPRDIFPPVQLFQRMPKPSRPPSRIVQIDAAYGANFELIYGYAGTGGYEIPLQRLTKFLKDIVRDELDGVMPTPAGVLDTRDRRLDMLSSRYFIVSEWSPRYLEFRNQPDRFRFLYTSADTDVYENLRALPPAYLVPASGAEIAPGDAAQLQRLKDTAFDPERQVVVAEALPVGAGQSTSTLSVPNVEWRTWNFNSFDLDVSATEPSVLVVSQMDYPGWRAYLDGASTSIHRANYAFPAIFIPQGSHHVRFSFQPWSFRLGLTLTIVSCAIAAICLKRRRIIEP